MSTENTKKIEVWVRPDIRKGLGTVSIDTCDKPYFRDMSSQATLVIGEKAFTESEVARIIREAFGERTGKGQGITWHAMVEAAQHFGIKLDQS